MQFNSDNIINYLIHSTFLKLIETGHFNCSNSSMYWVIDDSISCQCLLVAQFVDCCTVSQTEDGPASGLSCLQ